MPAKFFWGLSQGDFRIVVSGCGLGKWDEP